MERDKLNIKWFSESSMEKLEKVYNLFANENDIRYTQSNVSFCNQPGNACVVYSMCAYYVPKKVMLKLKVS